MSAVTSAIAMATQNNVDGNQRWIAQDQAVDKPAGLTRCRRIHVNRERRATTSAVTGNGLPKLRHPADDRRADRCGHNQQQWHEQRSNHHKGVSTLKITKAGAINDPPKRG